MKTLPKINMTFFPGKRILYGLLLIVSTLMFLALSPHYKSRAVSLGEGDILGADVYQLENTSGVPGEEGPLLSQTDQRFGITGDCNQLSKLGIAADWASQWGNLGKTNLLANTYNTREINCKNKGYNPLFTVGNTKGQGRMKESLDENAVRHQRNVMVLNFDPIMPDGQRLSKYMGWHDPMKQMDEMVNFFDEATEGHVNYKIVEEYTINQFPKKRDGFQYTSESYLKCMSSNNREEDCHDPDGVDYNNLIDVYNICEKVNTGTIHEVWLHGGPYFGYWESMLAGKNGYWYNSGPLYRADCDKLVIFMGFNYERNDGLGHTWAHRTESTMEKVYGKWEQNRVSNNWEKFALVEAQSPDYNYSGCGSAHFPPNGQDHYDYGNREVSTPSYCDSFGEFPNIMMSERRNIGCEEWNCDHTEYMKWWFNHIPRLPGVGTDGKLMDWWGYILYPENVYNNYSEQGDSAVCIGSCSQEDIISGWIAKAISRGYWDSEDEKLYRDVIAVAKSKDARGRAYPGKYRMMMEYVQLPFIAIESPEGYFQVGDEPDAQNYISPENYAKYYHAYYTRLKKYFPNVKVSVGGLAYPDYNHPVKGLDRYQAQTTNYPELLQNPYIVKRINSQNTEGKKEIYRSGTWLILSSIYYKKNYGSNIPVDFWSVHPIPRSTTKAQDGSRDYSGRYFNYYVPAVNDSINQLRMFKKILQRPEIAQHKKPVIISEFSAPEQMVTTKGRYVTDLEHMQAKYMKSFVETALSENLAQKFFWDQARFPNINNKNLSWGYTYLRDVPISFVADRNAMPKGLQLPKINKSLEGRIVAINHFYNPVKKVRTFQVVTSKYYAYGLNYKPGEDLSSREWSRAVPSKWTGNIDTSKPLQSFNTLYHPKKKALVQQVITDNNAWAREAPCTDTTCRWGNTWTNYGKFIAQKSSKPVLGFDTSVQYTSDGKYSINQTVVLEGDLVYARRNYIDGNGQWRWSGWEYKSRWRPATAKTGEILVDLYGGDPRYSKKLDKLEMVYFDPVRRTFNFYKWAPQSSKYMFRYSDNSLNPVANEFSKVVKRHKDSSAPVVTRISKQFYDRENGRLVFNVRSTDEGGSGIHKYTYSVGIGSAGWGGFILHQGERLSTSGLISIEIQDDQIDYLSEMYINVLVEDGYGNKSAVKTLKVQP